MDDHVEDLARQSRLMERGRDTLSRRLLVLLTFPLAYFLTIQLLTQAKEELVDNLRIAFIIVAVILAALAAIPPLPYSERLLAGALAFLAAAHFPGG